MSKQNTEAQAIVEDILQATKELAQEMAEVFGDPQVEAILMKHLHQANLDILDHLINKTSQNHGSMDPTPVAPEVAPR